MIRLLPAVLLVGCLDKPPPLDCPASYTRVGNGYYRVATDPQPFATAEAQCEGDRGNRRSFTHLAVFAGDDDSVELTRVSSYAFGIQERRVWVGASKRKTDVTGPFLWVTDEGPGPSDRLWGTGEPGYLLSEDCVGIRTADRLLYDTGCFAADVAFVCECDTHEPDNDNF